MDRIIPVNQLQRTVVTPATVSAPGRPINASATLVRPNIIPAQSNHAFEDDAHLIAVNQNSVPNSFTVTVQSLQGAGVAVNTTVFVINQDILNNITDNGSGAASITYTYQDGFAGRVISQIVSQARAAVGAACYGVAIRATLTATGAGNPAVLALTNPAFVMFNPFGRSQPLSYNITSDQTRKDFDTSIEVVPLAFNINRYSQYSFTVVVLNTYVCTFYLTNNFSR